MNLTLEEYRARRIVNVHAHVDGPWFWGRYSAHPYVGCRSGCEFCYQRDARYLGRRDPETYATHIRVKVNAPELLRKELARLPRDVIACGDWQQPAESRCRLSRQMLEVLRELAFPLFVVERSPLLVRDLDLLVEISRQTWVGVLVSISSLDPALKRAFEPRSAAVKLRLRAMRALADAGIAVGTALMPALPIVGDDARHLEDVVRATADHGGICVVAGGTTMSGVQAERTLAAATRLDPALGPRWRALYRWAAGGVPSYSSPGDHSARLGLTVRALCAKHGLLDRLPRYIAPGPLAINKRLAERLFLRTYDLELQQAEGYRVWAYRKAAWAVDEWPSSLSELYRERGEQGLCTLPGVGRSIAGEVAGWLREG